MESQIHEIQMMAERRKQKEAQEMARIRAKQEQDRKLLRYENCSIRNSKTVIKNNLINIFFRMRGPEGDRARSGQPMRGPRGPAPILQKVRNDSPNLRFAFIIKIDKNDS